jgi:hypothetical protein
LPFAWAAEREGGSQNGTLTALEDFVNAHEGMRLVTVPAFFGFGVVWHEEAPWADEVARFIQPWDRDPLIQRLEANRVAQIARLHVALERAEKQAARLHELDQRMHRQQALLRRFANSRAIRLVELLSRVRPGPPAISRAEIERVLADDGEPERPQSAGQRSRGR